MGYGGRSDWGMVRLAAWAFLPGLGARYVTPWRAAMQWVGWVVIGVIILAVRLAAAAAAKR